MNADVLMVCLSFCRNCHGYPRYPYLSNLSTVPPALPCSPPALIAPPLLISPPLLSSSLLPSTPLNLVSSICVQRAT